MQIYINNIYIYMYIYIYKNIYSKSLYLIEFYPAIDSIELANDKYIIYIYTWYSSLKEYRIYRKVSIQSIYKIR